MRRVCDRRRSSSRSGRSDHRQPEPTREKREEERGKSRERRKSSGRVRGKSPAVSPPAIPTV
eukprot:9503795-Pyramimonas_sp.AAC.2